MTNVIFGPKAWDAYPFILLNLFLSMLDPSSFHYDESESARHQG
jgi:hypothetical protein